MTANTTDWRTHQADLLEAWVTQIRAWEDQTDELVSFLTDLHPDTAQELRGTQSLLRMRRNDLNSKAAEIRIAALEENDA